MIGYELVIMDIQTKRTWTEYYDSYYLYRKRIIKLRYSKRLRIISQREQDE